MRPRKCTGGRKTATSSTGLLAILAHLAVVLGMVLIGYRHFDNVHTGVAAACLYLMLPYTAEATPGWGTWSRRRCWSGRSRATAAPCWPECSWAWPRA